MTPTAGADARRDRVWQDPALTRSFLAGVRGAIPFAAEQIALLLDLVAGTGRPVRRLLDLGCGDGVLTAAVRGRFPDAVATLVDFSPPMLDAARARFAAGGTAVRFVVADLAARDWATALPDRGPFDLVVSGYAIHHLPDDAKRRLYDDILTLLAPGGAFVNIEHVASASPALSALFDELLIDAIWAYRRQNDPNLRRADVAADHHARPDKDANILAPVEEQCAWLRELGFVEVDCYFKWLELAVFGGRRPPA